MATSALDMLSSKNNKGTLWNILYEKGVFNKLTNNDLENVKTMFDSTISQYKPTNDSKLKQLKLVDLNKDILTILIQKIDQYSANNAVKAQQQCFTSNLQQQHMSNMSQFEQSPLITSKEITSERLRQFEQSLFLKEQEMQAVMKLKKPEEINFKDENDEAPLEMEKSLQSMIERRRNDFNQVINEGDKSHAEKWISNDNKHIDDTVKKVSFDDTMEQVDILEEEPSFFNKLKQQNEHDQIMSKLQEISAIQQQILHLIIPGNSTEKTNTF